MAKDARPQAAASPERFKELGLGQHLRKGAYRRGFTL